MPKNVWYYPEHLWVLTINWTKKWNGTLIYNWTKNKISCSQISWLFTSSQPATNPVVVHKAHFWIVSWRPAFHIPCFSCSEYGNGSSSNLLNDPTTWTQILPSGYLWRVLDVVCFVHCFHILGSNTTGICRQQHVGRVIGREEWTREFHFLSKALMNPILLCPCLPDIPSPSLFKDRHECTLKSDRYVH